MPRGDHDHRMASLRKLDEAAREERRLGLALREAQKKSLESGRPSGGAEAGTLFLFNDYPFLRAAAEKLAKKRGSTGDDIEVRRANMGHPR